MRTFNPLRLFLLSVVFLCASLMIAIVSWPLPLVVAQNPAAVWRLRYGLSLPTTCQPATGMVFFKTSAPIGIHECTATDTWTKLGASGSGAPTDATYITQTANGTLSAEQAMSALATGLVKNTTSTGVQSIATATDVEAPLFCADAGANDTYTCSLSPAIASYVTGTHYRFKANTANTGAATINFNSLGAITIKKVAGGITTDLATDDIRAGQWVDVIYDGTNMQMQSTLGNAATGGSTNPTSNDLPVNVAGSFADSALRQDSGHTDDVYLKSSSFFCFDASSGNEPCLMRSTFGTDWGNGVIGVVKNHFTDNEYASMKMSTVDVTRLVMSQRGVISGTAGVGVIYFEESGTLRFKYSENNGTMKYAFPQRYSTTLDVPSLAAGASHSVQYGNAMPGTLTGAGCVAGLSSIGSNSFIVGCQIEGDWTPRITILNAGGTTVDLASGTLNIVVWDR